jgi:hypothetical protein
MPTVTKIRKGRNGKDEPLAPPQALCRLFERVEVREPRRNQSDPCAEGADR